MKPPYTVSDHDLLSIPIRAMVAYAARCARRSQDVLARCHPAPEPSYTQVTDRATQAAEDFARGGLLDPAALQTIRQEAYALAATIQKLTYRSVAYACAHAAAAAHEAAQGSQGTPETPFAGVLPPAAAQGVWTAAYGVTLASRGVGRVTDEHFYDLQALCDQKLGKFPELGPPVDPAETGPLGTLWPKGFPEHPDMQELARRYMEEDMK
jgi:hypothetical protein